MLDEPCLEERTMSDESASPSCISHLSIGTNDFPRARAFYDAVMAALGCR